jgi:hypothetical protein
MPPGISPGIRGVLLAVLAVPASVLALAVGLLWLLGLLCGQRRREYITGITQQAMSAIVGIFHGAAAASSSLEATENLAEARTGANRSRRYSRRSGPSTREMLPPS